MLLLAITLGVLAPTAPISKPPCEAPPAGSNDTVKVCFESACKTYQNEYEECETTLCRRQAKLRYLEALHGCLLSQTPIGPSGWITFWHDGDEWHMSTEPDAPATGLVLKF